MSELYDDETVEAATRAFGEQRTWRLDPRDVAEAPAIARAVLAAVAPLIAGRVLETLADRLMTGSVPGADTLIGPVVLRDLAEQMRERSGA